MGNALSDAIAGIRSWSMDQAQDLTPSPQVSEIFGSLVFNDSVQQARLPRVYLFNRLRAGRPPEAISLLVPGI